MPESVLSETGEAKTRIISYADAVREALTECGKRDRNVLFLAEGIADPSSVYGTTKGLGTHCPDQLIEMPLSENALVGIAVGAALSGKRPVINFHRVEFALLAVEQIVNNAAKAHYISRGRHSVPLVIRLVIGRGWGQGPEHSQSLESIFAHFPGLKVIMPTFPRDAKGMLIAAIRDDNPVIVIEHRWCHYSTGAVPEGDAIEALDGPRVVRAGRDVTLVGTSYATLEALRAADALAAIGVEAEVVDLRVLRPLVPDLILDSVGRTGRLVTIDTGWWRYGIGAEIVAEVTTRRFGALKSAPIRLGMPEHPTPSSRGMVPGVYPDAVGIVAAVGRQMELAEDAVASVQAALTQARGGLPPDVPDPFFKGPF